MNGRINECDDTNSEYIGPLSIRFVIDAILLLSFLYVSYRVYADYRAGGNSWKQGDWLINNAAGPVRRGPFGQLVISLSDILGASPLLVVVVIQIILLAGLFFVFRILVTEVESSRVAILLITSPAIFVVFWVADPQGSVRKELIVFLGISLYALGSIRRNWAMIWVGVAIFCVSTLAHEAMILFLPTFFAIMIFSKLSDCSVLHARLSLYFSTAFSIFALHFAIRNPSLPDSTAVCFALLDRGVSKSVCGGAIAWLAYDRAHAVEAVTSFLDFQRLTDFILSYIAAIAPIIYVLSQTDRRVIGVCVTALSAVPFLILYPVALDWGRWISLHIFSITAILICVLVRYDTTIRGRLSFFKYFAIMGLLVSPLHMSGVMWGGASKQLVRALWRLLG